MKLFISAMEFIFNSKEETRGEDAMLCHIYKKTNTDDECLVNQLIISDLVYSQKFGTGPTVHSKVRGLIDRGLIELIKSPTDARAKIIIVTKGGEKYLDEQSKVLSKLMSAKA